MGLGEETARPGPSSGQRGRPAAWPLGPRSPLRRRFLGHLGRVFARRLFPLNPWRGMSRDQRNPTHLPRLLKSPARAPIPCPGPGPLGRALPGRVQGNASMCAGAAALWLPSLRVSSRTPLRPSLSFRRIARVGVASGAGRPGEPREAGGRARGGELWAGCLQRALSPARCRCRCCPCLRGRPAGLWST